VNNEEVVALQRDSTNTGRVGTNSMRSLQTPRNFSSICFLGKPRTGAGKLSRTDITNSIMQEKMMDLKH
jgi:hypothetical protein